MSIAKTKKRAKLIKFLKSRSSYPHKPKKLKHIQTHASDVFIVPPFVYKVKKPVNFRFLDFSTLNKRKYYCERELELNRRLCSDIYLNVEKISINCGNLTFSNGDKVVEYAVKMKKLPEKYFLMNLLKKGKVDKYDFTNIVKKLVVFYNNQHIDREINKFGEREKIKFNIYENFDLSKKFVEKTISSSSYEAIKLYNDTFFKIKSKLFNKRVKLGFIKDCHGDLHLEHINYAPKDINIFDCIEFNNRFRYIDIASDIAFLSMDLDFNGYPKFGNFVVSEVSKKLEDKTIFEIVDFYKCYRAYVRGKVESIRSEAPEVSEKDRKFSHEKSKKYFQLALRYSLFGSKPGIIVIFGLIGTGKTTLANLLSDELSAEVISSDQVRKEITGTKLTEREFKGFSKGIYSKKTTDQTYNEVLKKGIREIQLGKNVILDASYSKRKYRNEVRLEAKKLGVPLLFIETAASKNIIRKRLLEREKVGKSISDARWEIFEDFNKRFEEPSELSMKTYFMVNTKTNFEETLVKALKNAISKNFLE